MRYEIDLSIEAPDFTAALLAAISELSKALQARLAGGAEQSRDDVTEEARRQWN